MQQEEDGPNFTLARNFPRIVKWKGDRPDGRSVEADEKGEREMARRWRRRRSWGRRLRMGRRIMVGLEPDRLIDVFGGPC
jgi:hypothetical protein